MLFVFMCVEVNNVYTATMNSLQVTSEHGHLYGLEGELTSVVTYLWLEQHMRAGITCCHRCLSTIIHSLLV